MFIWTIEGVCNQQMSRHIGYISECRARLEKCIHSHVNKAIHWLQKCECAWPRREVYHFGKACMGTHLQYLSANYKVQ